MFQCGQSHPWWGNSFGVLSLWEAALTPWQSASIAPVPTCCPSAQTSPFPFSACRWLEMLIVYPRTNKQNQKKKRKVEPPTPQVTPGGRMLLPGPFPLSQGHGITLLPGKIPPPQNQPEQWAASPLMLPAQRARARASQDSRTV